MAATMPDARSILFAPITKIDAVQRLVYGTAAVEEVDKTEEVFDYASSKPLVEEWSDGIAKATDGKSKGNVRAMHGKVAAGRLDALEFDDKRRAIDVVAKIVDDDEWTKVEEGVYTGFSIGGSYVKKWTDDDGRKRYTAKPSEISIVDNPCMPSATFSMVKADGVVEQRAFKQAPKPPESAATETRDPTRADPGEKLSKWVAEHAAANDDVIAQAWLAKDGTPFVKKDEARAHNASAAVASNAAPTDPAAKLQTALDAAKASTVAKRELSDDERKKAADAGEAMPDGSYPIKNKSDIENAIKAYGRAKNKTAVKAHILKRAKDLGADDALPDAWKESEKVAAAYDLRKGLSEVARLAYLIQELEWCQQYAEYEASAEGDSSPVPAALKEDIANLCSTLRQMVEEETNELLEGDEAYELGELLEASARASLRKVAGDKGDKLLAKAGARHSKGDKVHLDAAHDHISKAMGLDGKEAHDGLMGKADAAADAHLAHAHNMTKMAGAGCPGGESKCMGDGEAEKFATLVKSKGGDTKAAHIQAAHDHLHKMGIGGEDAEKLIKAGARHSAADLDHLNKAHGALVEAGADHPGGEPHGETEPKAGPEDQAGDETEEKMAKLEKGLVDRDTRIATLEKVTLEAADAIPMLLKRIEHLESQPLARPHERAGYRTVSKGAEEPDEVEMAERLSKMTPEERTRLLVQAARANPQTYERRG